MNYINEYSWKSFLSIATKDVQSKNGFHWFRTRKNWQVLKVRSLEEADIDFLKDLVPFNFFYFSFDEVKLLQKHFKVRKSKDPDVAVDISNLSFSGKKYRDIRNYINRYSGRFEVLDDLKNPSDYFPMLEKWDDTCGDKYFQVRTGKNRYFFKNGLHKDCINSFVYDGDDLISFAILSPPDENGYSSYIIGKALSFDYPGLSEYTDVVAYEKARKQGVSIVNLGGGPKKLIRYKMKFPNAFRNDTYDGTVDEIR